MLFLALSSSVPSRFICRMKAEELFRLHAVYVCAGYAALIAYGCPEEEALLGCESDIEQAGSFLQEGKSGAISLFRKVQNRAAVELIADELVRIKTLDHSQVSTLLEVADGEATMDDYWEFLKTQELWLILLKKPCVRLLYVKMKRLYFIPVVWNMVILALC